MEMTTNAAAAKRSPMRLGDIMNTDVATIGSKVAANAAWSRMKKRGLRYLLVTEDGRALGILSERHLGGQSGKGDKEGAEVRKRRLVDDLMTHGVVGAGPTETLQKALNTMREQQVGYLLIEEDGRPAGIVSADDVMDELGRDPLRAPYPGWLPRSAKPESEAYAQPAPAHIRMLGADLTKEQRMRIRRDLGARLGKFSDSIERVSVRVEDINGPRGGTDQVCRIKVVLSNLPSVVFESRDVSLAVAIGSAIAGIEQAVRRRLQRRRMRPLKVGAQSLARSRARAS